MSNIYEFTVYPQGGLYLGAVPKYMKIKGNTFTSALKQVTDRGYDENEIRKCLMPDGVILYSDKFDQVVKDEYREWKENKNK